MFWPAYGKPPAANFISARSECPQSHWPKYWGETAIKPALIFNGILRRLAFHRYCSITQQTIVSSQHQQQQQHQPLRAHGITVKVLLNVKNRELFLLKPHYVDLLCSYCTRACVIFFSFANHDSKGHSNDPAMIYKAFQTII